jgi:predicted transcriptional regulator
MALRCNLTKRGKDRREFDTVVRILRAASKGVKKNELKHRCKLPPSVMGKYLSALTELGLVEAKDAGDICYKTTDKGLELLHTYHKLKWLLWGKTFDFMLVGLLTRLKLDRKEREKYTGYIS